MLYSKTRKRSFSNNRHSRRNTNYIPLFVYTILFSLLIWAFFYFISKEQIVSALAEISILKGDVKILLNGNEDLPANWKPTYSKHKFAAGSIVQTVRRLSRISFSIENFHNTGFFIKEKTKLYFTTLEYNMEETKKIVKLKLQKGVLWGYLPREDFESDSGFIFEVETPRIVLQLKKVNKTAIFNIESNTTQDTISIIEGDFIVKIKTLKDPNIASTSSFDKFTLLHDYPLISNQKLIISNQTLSTIATTKMNNVSAIGLSEQFSRSPWHLENLAIFDKQSANEIKESIQVERTIGNLSDFQSDNEITSKKSVTSDLDLLKTFPSPTFVSPKNSDKVVANLPTHLVLIEGQTAPNTKKIIIDNPLSGIYPLTQFQAGDRVWRYLIKKKFASIKSGENTIFVTAVSMDGVQSEPSKLTFFYEGTVENPSIIKPESSITLEKEVSSAFVAPTISSPIPLSEVSKVYQTSSKIVTLTGTIDPKTTKVKVNDYVLKNYTAGSIRWKYIANADMKPSNLKIGENIYTITAFDSQNRTASITTKIIYMPINAVSPESITKTKISVPITVPALPTRNSIDSSLKLSTNPILLDPTETRPAPEKKTGNSLKFSN